MILFLYNNLSNQELSASVLYYLRHGLDHSFVNKNRHIKLNLATEMENLLTAVIKTIPQHEKENFKHLLRVHCNLFHNNLYNKPDYTYKVLQKLATDPNLVVFSGDKDSSVVIMERDLYVSKIEGMIKDGIKKGKYAKTEDTTLKDLKSFQSFLTRNYRGILPLDKITPSSNQPAFLYGTAKTHKFDNPCEINKENLKLRPIVSTCGTYYYETAKYLASYLIPLTENEYNIKNTTDFSQRLNNRSLDDQEITVSYDVSSLFTEVPLNETIEYITDEIYTRNKLRKLGSKLQFQRLLSHVTKNTVFSFNNQLYRQIDGCGMGNPLSPVLANIFMTKLETDIVRPYNPPFYDRYVDDCFSKKVKGEPDQLFERLNNYHPNIIFTVEEDPDHFLDTKFKYDNQSFHRSVYRKPGKVPTHWSSKVPTSWKRNSILGALHRAKRISTDLKSDVREITKIYLSAGYPKRFIQSTINNFNNSLKNTDEKLIPEFMFEERKKVFIKLPYCPENEKLAKRFINKLNTYTCGKFIFIILWQTRKIRSLFNLKDTNHYKSNVVYRAECVCGETYIGETKRNFIVRKREHENVKHNSEPARHLATNSKHKYKWKIIFSESNTLRRKIIEGLFIARDKPSLNKQVHSYAAKLFPSGVT